MGDFSKEHGILRMACVQTGGCYKSTRSGNAGHAAERGPDRDRPDPTRTDAKTQSNSIYLAQVPQNSRF